MQLLSFWIALLARDRKAQVRCKSRGADGDETFGEPLGQVLGLLGSGLRCRNCLQLQIMIKKPWFLPDSHPRNDFAVPFPLPCE